MKLQGVGEWIGIIYIRRWKKNMFAYNLHFPTKYKEFRLLVEDFSKYRILVL